MTKKSLPSFNLLDKNIANLPFNWILGMLSFELNVGENLHRGLEICIWQLNY